MNNNYLRMQEFLDEIKQFAISNPDKSITADFVYSRLIHFYSPAKTIINASSVKNSFFAGWKNRYKRTSNIEVTYNLQGNFCWFLNTYDVENAIKLYIPMNYGHINKGANQLFDFIVSTNMLHQSKIAMGIRNDNVVSRVTSLEDAMKIIEFVSSNNYIKEGMLNVNPFLPNINGVGITMDNDKSFNGELSASIANFIEYLKSQNRLDLVTVEEYNKFIKNQINNVSDLELKDIYILLSKTTSKDFKIAEFLEFANDKLLNKYDQNENRIVDPSYYLEEAIIINEKYYPGNAKIAILYLMNAIYNGFTRKENARSIVRKFVKPGDVIPLMRSKLQQSGIEIPHTDEELITKYVALVLSNSKKMENENSYQQEFEIIKRAYLNTLNTYDQVQAKEAFLQLFYNNNVGYFSNRFGDRDNLINSVLPKSAQKVILNNIDIEDVDINMQDSVFYRFLERVNNVNRKSNLK